MQKIDEQRDFSKGTVKLSQGVVTFHEIGVGPTIVFVHGLLLNGSIWRRTIEMLATRYRCIVPELPFGGHHIPMDSTADLSPEGSARLVADFLEILDLSDVTLVGNDFGGVVTMATAARFGERVSRVVLGNCDALEVFPAKGFEFFSWLPRVPGAFWVLAKIMYHFSFVRNGPTSFGAFLKHPLPNEETRAWVEPLARLLGVRHDAGKMMLGMDKELTMRLPSELKRSLIPTLLVWGSEDHLFTLDLAHRLKAAIGPQTSLVEVRDAKAFVMLDAPEAFADAVDQFLREHRPWAV
ncbi:MAG: alpha/beta hydrolase [Parvibaculaceae bacterium]|nr:alpha/beta hydrolase [Parvibaculaceae bacterium]